MMKKCPKCYTNVPRLDFKKEEKYCSRCGTKLEEYVIGDDK
jgi:rRNA maturation endonuclease Nob1